MQPSTTQAYFRNLTILHAALMLGQIIMAAGIYFLFNAGKAPIFGAEAAGQNWVYIVGGLTIISVLVSAQLFNTKIKQLRNLKNLPAKLNAYRSATILRYAFLELPSLAAILLYMQTNNLLLLIFTGLILLLFIAYRPTKERLITDLELSPSEQAEL